MSHQSLFIKLLSFFLKCRFCLRFLNINVIYFSTKKIYILGNALVLSPISFLTWSNQKKQQIWNIPDLTLGHRFSFLQDSCHIHTAKTAERWVRDNSEWPWTLTPTHLKTLETIIAANKYALGFSLVLKFNWTSVFQRRFTSYPGGFW